MVYDQAQSSRLGQRLAVENPGVRLVNATTEVQAPYKGQVIYDVTLGLLMIYNGITWSGVSAGDLSANTVDTGVPYRIIIFADGTVRGIPYATPVPTAPTGLARVIKVSSVKLSWTAATTPAALYEVFRGGSLIGTSFGLTYRDGTVVTGNTYSYQVRTKDAYGQVSPLTAAVTAFVDPALNVAPTVTVTSWPTTAPTNGKTILRVCGADADAQTLVLALGTDTGTLTPTDDPSIWYYHP